MKRIILSANRTIYENICKLNDRHPYSIPFFFSCLFIIYALFATPSLEVIDQDILPTSKIDFVDFDKIVLPKRKVNKEISQDESSEPSPEARVEKATGLSDVKDAVDIDFYSNIVPPKMISTLKKDYPLEARKLNLNAVVYVNLLIGISGKVRAVDIITIRLSKQLPDEVNDKMQALFAKATRKMFFGKTFSKTLLNGKTIAIKVRKKIEFDISN